MHRIFNLVFRNAFYIKIRTQNQITEKTENICKIIRKERTKKFDYETESRKFILQNERFGSRCDLPASMESNKMFLPNAGAIALSVEKNGSFIIPLSSFLGKFNTNPNNAFLYQMVSF